ncbi:MAG: LPS-assembly protein LptD, partial [Deltaproteobacteria bacterium]|nr:LPS-assembly protein LptD [Deltaproteobacteria bacterium]
LLILAAGSSLAYGQQARLTTAGPEGWTFWADKITGDRRSGMVEALGNVVIEKGSDRLQADQARFNEKSRTVEMWGNVVFTSKDFSIECERLILDLDTKNGKIFSGTIFFAPKHYYVKGEEIEKTGPDTFTLSKGRITTCDGDSPAWSLTARNITVRHEGYASGTHATITTRHFPIFYSPYFIVPVKTTRQSGFLTPEIKASDRDGLTVTVPFYWAVSDAVDMTISPTYMADRGTNFGFEFRHTYWGGKGTYKLDFLEDRHPPPAAFSGREPSAPMDRYWLRAKADYTSPGGALVRFDLDQVSDPELLVEFELSAFGFHATNEQFFQEYNRGLPEARNPRRESTLQASKFVNPYYLGLAFEATDDLDSPGNPMTLQRLPHLIMDIPRTPFGETPLYVTLDASYTHFTRESGNWGHRVDLHPRMHLPFTLFGNFDLDPSFGFRETLYYPSGPNANLMGTGGQSREVYDLEFEASTRFTRIFNVNRGGIEKIKHRLKPRLAYKYVSEAPQDHLPRYDFNDRVEHAEVIEYGLDNYFVSRFGRGSRSEGSGRRSADYSSYREFLRLSLSRTYNLLEARRVPVDPTDRPRIHGPWKADYAFTYNPYFSINGESEFDTRTNNFSFHSLTVNIRDRRGDRLFMEYDFKQDTYEEVRYYLSLVLNKKTALQFGNRYSLTREMFLESIVALDYRSQCWAVRLEYIDRPQERAIVLAFGLTGLGESGAYKIRAPN